MSDQVFESLRKVTESSLQLQQEFIKQWSQQGTPSALNAAGVSADWIQEFQKRWIEFAMDALSKHRASLDSAYKSGIEAIEQSLRLAENKTPEGYRQAAEVLSRKWFETFKEQSENQLREFQKGVQKWFEIVPQPKA